jgi:hypothetical protein
LVMPSVKLETLLTSTAKNDRVTLLSASIEMPPEKSPLTPIPPATVLSEIEIPPVRVPEFSTRPSMELPETAMPLFVMVPSLMTLPLKLESLTSMPEITLALVYGNGPLYGVPMMHSRGGN